MWLKIKETWWALLIVFFITIGAYWVGRLFFYIFNYNDYMNEIMKSWAAGFILLVILTMIGMLIFLFVTDTIPWIKQNWEQAKEIYSERDKK
jgi:zinc transporter ZupT